MEQAHRRAERRIDEQGIVEQRAEQGQEYLLAALALMFPGFQPAVREKQVRGGHHSAKAVSYTHLDVYKRQSLWWGGVGIFSLLGLLALTGRAVLGRWLAGLAVLLDCVLLGIMILTLPCVACMVAALLLALSYITFRAATLADTHRSALRHASPLLVLWGALFLLTLGGLARSEVGPWALQAPEMEDETTARVRCV